MSDIEEFKEKIFDDIKHIDENENEYWKSLKDKVKLLFFDEGHREPAKYWRTVIRQFDCKKVLFTATPYRNDKTIFDVDPNFVFEYFTAEAIKYKSIVKPRFKEIDTKFFENDELLSEFISDQTKENNHKVLVRMKDSERIKRVVNILNSVERCAAGFHSNFSIESNLFDKGEKIYDVKNEFTYQYKSNKGLNTEIIEEISKQKRHKMKTK